MTGSDEIPLDDTNCKTDTEIAVNNLNYRGIIILSVLVSDKIPNRILLERTNAAVDLLAP